MSSVRQFVYIAVFACITVKVLATTTPIMVVISGSMEPQLYRGDAIITHNTTWSDIRIGEIVVFELPNGTTPIVHRVIRNFTHSVTGRVRYITKGDNNPVDDSQLYRRSGLRSIGRENIIGRECGIIRMIPYMMLWMIELFDWLGVTYSMRLSITAASLLYIAIREIYTQIELDFEFDESAPLF
jgi:signal peptidase I